MKDKVTFATAALALTVCLAARAEPTTVEVYVQSHDAKFVGTSVGGARVTLTDAATGEVLARGLTEGGTGDTDLIMRTPRTRSRSTITEDTAVFRTRLDVEAPTQVLVTAEGPLDYPESARTVSSQRWLLPGEHRTDADAWLLDLPGLIVDLNDPSTTPLRLDRGTAELTVRAHVAMMCGCPVMPDGLWDSADFEIEAALLQEDRVVRRVAMRYAGEPSKFAANLTVTRAGTYEVVVTAVQAGTGNIGVARFAFVAL